MHSIIGQRTLCGVFGAMTLFAALSTGYVSASQERWQLTMNNAELRDVVEEISSILGKTVILDPKVQGRITVMSSQALDREGVRRLFYSVLDTHGFSVIDQGDQILVVPVAQAKSLSADAQEPTAAPEQFVTQVIALGISNASDLAGLIRPLISTNGYVGPSVSANALVITDTARNVRRISEVVRQLDSGAKNTHELVELRHGVAVDIARLMEGTLGKQNAESAISVLADPRGNRLVIVGTAAVRQRLVQLARSLDTAAPERLDNARVIRLRYSDAKQLAEVLDTMGQGSKSPLSALGLKDTTANAPFMVRADESQNALVVVAEPAQLATLEGIVRELDRPRAQVLIHAAIVEISGDIAEALGVQWALNGSGASGLINFPGTGLPIIGGLKFDEKSVVPEARRLTGCELPLRILSSDAFATRLADTYSEGQSAAEQVAAYTEARQASRQKIQLALVYPALLMTACVAIVGFLLGYVVPDVVKIFVDSGQPLPRLTQAMIAVSHGLRAYGLVLLVVLAGIVIGLRWSLQQTRGRWYWHRLALRIPLVGGVLRAMEAARFASTLAILGKSAVPLVDALEIAAAVIGNVTIRARMADVARSVREGGTLTRGLEAGGDIPPLMLHMIASGESAGETGDGADVVQGPGP